MRIWVLPIILGLMVACGCGQQGSGDATPEPEAAPASASEETAGGESASTGLKGKKVVMIVAHRDFRDEELLKPREILEKAGAKVSVASSSVRPAKGMLGATVEADLLVKDVNPADYDAIVLVGGPGATEYWKDEKTHKIARRAAEEGKILAAICIAPVTLANAGVLKDKKATVWKSEAPQLRAMGAIYTGRDVETDGRIITADGPKSAEKFGRAIFSALSR